MLVDRIASELQSCDTDTLERIARILAVCPKVHIKQKNPVGRPLGSGKKQVGERELAMKALFDEGKTFQDIATIHGITRERVRQILGRFFSLTGKENVVRYNNVTIKNVIIAMDKKHQSDQREEERYSRLFKCSKDSYISSLGEPFCTNKKQDSPGWRYLQQKKYAERRGIRWDISFPEWWSIWEKSGKYHLRSRGHGYCMARVGDSGSYSVGNVYICTNAQNIKDGYIIHPAADRVAKMRITLSLKKAAQELQASA